MNVLALYEELEKMLRSSDRFGDWKVVVPIDKKQVGGSAAEEVKSVFQGFDWDHGKVFLRTEKPLVEKSEREKVHDSALDLIVYLATKPVKRPTYEILKARGILRNHGWTDKKMEEYSKYFHPEKKKKESPRKKALPSSKEET